MVARNPKREFIKGEFLLMRDLVRVVIPKEMGMRPASILEGERPESVIVVFRQNFVTGSTTALRYHQRNHL